MPSGAESQNSRTSSVVGMDDRILVDCRELQLQEIRAYFEPILSRNPNKPVILYTESEAEYQRMVELSVSMDAELAPGSEVRRGERTSPVDSFAGAMVWLLSEAGISG